MGEPYNPASPTRVRYSVLAWFCALSSITYIDRVSISQAAPFITEELGLTRVQMGFAFAAFSWAYALFQIPGGWMSDWIGPRRVLTGIVLSFAHTVGEFGVVLMIGGNLPGTTRTVSISIYDSVQSLDYAAANRTASALLVFSFAVLAVTYALQRRLVQPWPAR